MENISGKHEQPPCRFENKLLDLLKSRITANSQRSVGLELRIQIPSEPKRGNVNKSAAQAAYPEQGRQTGTQQQHRGRL